MAKRRIQHLQLKRKPVSRDASTFDEIVSFSLYKAMKYFRAQKKDPDLKLEFKKNSY
jgi:hypothetical protein